MSKSNIKLCKQNNVLPERGVRVQTKTDASVAPEGFLVHSKHTDCRKNTVGEFWGFAPGTGGDVWIIKHEDGDLGAYLYTEVFDPVTEEDVV